VFALHRPDLNVQHNRTAEGNRDKLPHLREAQSWFLRGWLGERCLIGFRVGSARRTSIHQHDATVVPQPCLRFTPLDLLGASFEQLKKQLFGQTTTRFTITVGVDAGRRKSRRTTMIVDAMNGLLATAVVGDGLFEKRRKSHSRSVNPMTIAAAEFL